MHHTQCVGLCGLQQDMYKQHLAVSPGVSFSVWFRPTFLCFRAAQVPAAAAVCACRNMIFGPYLAANHRISCVFSRRPGSCYGCSLCMGICATTGWHVSSNSRSTRTSCLVLCCSTTNSTAASRVRPALPLRWASRLPVVSLLGRSEVHLPVVESVVSPCALLCCKTICSSLALIHTLASR
jgi:hypothetical protein